MLDEPTGGSGGSGTVRTDPFIQVAFVHEALDDYAEADLAQLDDEWLAQLFTSLERVKVRVDAAVVAAAAEAERRGPKRDQGFSSTRSYIKHHARLSGPEARARMQLHRMFELLPGWKAAAESGNTNLGDDQLRLMARVAANPRIRTALAEVADELLTDAEIMSYDAFARRLRDFERSVDCDGAKAAAEQAHDARDTVMRQQPDGSWRLSARFGSLQGAEINEVLAHFNQAQFESDWAEAKERLGDDVTFDDLGRIEPQRRADALHAALLGGAANPGGGRAPLPCLNVLIDEATLEAALTGRPLDWRQYPTMVCRTQNGDEIDVSEAAALALYAHVRRVVHNGAKVVTELGRKSRVFRGNNREAATLLTDRCIWPGCDRQVRTCQVDHNVAWMHDGATDPDNGAVMCGMHNRLKHRGRFRAFRRPDGDWLILDADNEPVG
jgi:hypothetical protein